MNVRSFADLEDVLIESHTNNSYDEDLFEVDSSMREQLVKPEERYDNSQKSPGGLDYADDFCESEEYLCPAILLDDAANVDLENYERSCDSIDDRQSSPRENSMFEQPTKGGPSILHDGDIIHPVADLKLSAANSIKECSTAQQHREVVDINSVQSEIPKAVTISQNPLVGNNFKNKSQFSNIEKVSIEDTQILNYFRRKNDAIAKNGKEKGSIRTSKTGHDRHTPHGVIPKDTNRVDVRSAAVTQTASRALHIPTVDHGMSKSTVKKIMSKPIECSAFGIPDYDPDYDCALEMMRNPCNPIGASNKHANSRVFDTDDIGIMPQPLAPRFQFEKSREKQDFDFSADVKSDSRREMSTRLSPVVSERPYNQNVLDFQNVEIDRIAENNRVAATTYRRKGIETKEIPPSLSVSAMHRGAANMVMSEIREGKITSNLLRLGIDRDMLSSKCEEIHSSFLSDLLGTFRTEKNRSEKCVLLFSLVIIM